jgi:hypothetical protein
MLTKLTLNFWDTSITHKSLKALDKVFNTCPNLKSICFTHSIGLAKGEGLPVPEGEEWKLTYCHPAVKKYERK